jgi:hypothetical protein
MKKLFGGKESDILIIGVVAFIGFKFLSGWKTGFAPKQAPKQTI